MNSHFNFLIIVIDSADKTLLAEVDIPAVPIETTATTFVPYVGCVE
jgi:hypothetical protein